MRDHLVMALDDRGLFVKVANSVSLLAGAWAVILGASAAAYAVVEHAGLLDGAYWAIVTATTLGYGDFSPKTTGGKVLTSALISVTVFFLIPTITANLASKLIVDRDAFTHEEQEDIKSALLELLARTERSDPPATLTEE